MALRGLVLVLLLGAVCAIASSSAVSAAPSPLARRASHSHNVAGETRPAASSSAASAKAAEAAKAAAAANSPEAPTGLGQAQPGPSAAGGASAPSAPGPSSGIGTGIATTAAPARAAGLARRDQPLPGRRRARPGDRPARAGTPGIVAHLTYVAKTPKAAGHRAVREPAHREPGQQLLHPGRCARGQPQRPVLRCQRSVAGRVHRRLVQRAVPRDRDAAGAADPGRLRATRAATRPASTSSAASMTTRPPRTAPILFPGDGMTTNLTSYTGGESPDPLETCGWTDNGSGYGVPLIALLPSAPRAGSERAGRRGRTARVLSTANGQLCVGRRTDLSQLGSGVRPDRPADPARRSRRAAHRPAALRRPAATPRRSPRPGRARSPGRSRFGREPRHSRGRYSDTTFALRS